MTSPSSGDGKVGVVGSFAYTWGTELHCSGLMACVPLDNLKECLVSEPRAEGSDTKTVSRDQRAARSSEPRCLDSIRQTRYQQAARVCNRNTTVSKAEVSSSFNVLEQHPMSHTRAPPMQTHPAVRVGFKLVANCIQFHVFSNQDKTYHISRTDIKLLHPRQMYNYTSPWFLWDNGLVLR